MLWRPLRGNIPTWPMSSAKRNFVIVLPPVLTVPSWSSNASAIILSEKICRGWGRADILGELQLWFGTILLCCHGRLAGRLVVGTFCGSDKVVIDVIQLCGCPQSCMPNSVERRLEVHEDKIKALRVFQVF